jgi:uncharacterized protein (TIGR03067 family)
VERKSTDRPLDYAPDERLSWMAELLPYLSDDTKDLAQFLDTSKSWNEGRNLIIARRVVPTFLARTRADTPFVVHYPGLYWDVGATHFVGIAGVGLDAAEGNPNSPRWLRKIGVFGYDRVTTKDDIRDGLDRTILLIQVPTGPLDQKSPWLAGGGATVRGVSEDETCLQPFICAERDGKPGTYAIMCDGKVRWIPADLKPDMFRAMCTINGQEKIDKLDQLCPVIDENEDRKPQDKKPEDKKPADADETLKPLQGTWVLQAREVLGNAIPPVGATTLVITGDEAVYTQKAEVLWKAKVTVAGRGLDLNYSAGANAGNRSQALFEMPAVNVLNICMSDVAGKARPDNMDTLGNKDLIIFRFVRPK